jgi:hypothetical protein
MKQIIPIFALCIISFPFLLNAQNTSYEISAGISSALYKMDKHGTESSDLKIGFTGGFSLNFKTGNSWAIQPGLYFVQKGGVETEMNINKKIYTTLNYIELPVNMMYSKRGRFFFGFGLFGAYGFSGKIEIKDSIFVEKKINFGHGTDDLKPFDAGINVVMGYRFPSGVFFSLNIVPSVNNLSNNDPYYFSNGYIGIKAGYLFSD